MPRCAAPARPGMPCVDRQRSALDAGRADPPGHQQGDTIHEQQNGSATDSDVRAFAPPARPCREREHRREPHRCAVRRRTPLPRCARLRWTGSTATVRRLIGNAATSVAQYRAQAEPGLVRQAGQIDEHALQIARRAAGSPAAGARAAPCRRACRTRSQCRQQHRQHQQAAQQGRPAHGRQQDPTDQEQGDSRRRHQAATQVVEHLAARQQRQGIGCAHGARATIGDRGTHGSSQGSSCQSPRIQRCAAIDVGGIARADSLHTGARR